jgi:hypothetical protein
VRFCRGFLSFMVMTICIEISTVIEVAEKENKKGRMTVEEAGHRGGEAVSHKVPRIREEDIERGAYPAGKPEAEPRPPITVPKGIKRGEMTMRQAGHLGGRAVSHKLQRTGEEKGEKIMSQEEWREKAKETLHKAGEKGGHKAGEEVAGKVPRIREENKERGARPLKGEKKR